LIGWGCKKQVAPSADTGAEEPGIEEVEPGVPEGWKEYKNEDAGFMFWYPNDLDVHIEIINVNEVSEVPDIDNPWLLTKADVIEEQEEINNNPVGYDLSFRGDRITRSYYSRIVAFGNEVKAKKYLGTSQGGSLLVSYIFYRNGYRVEIWISKDLPESVYDVNGVVDNVLFNQLLEQIDQRKAPEEIQNFFNEFDQSIGTLQVLD
ncbi:MAG: hypothetical protein QXN96_06560, partial [Candidatus Bathyarchaeia archaeon]